MKGTLVSIPNRRQGGVHKRRKFKIEHKNNKHFFLPLFFSLGIIAGKKASEFILRKSKKLVLCLCLAYTVMLRSPEITRKNWTC